MSVKVTPRKIKIPYTLEMVSDIKAMHGIDIESNFNNFIKDDFQETNFDLFEMKLELTQEFATYLKQTHPERYPRFITYSKKCGIPINKNISLNRRNNIFLIHLYDNIEENRKEIDEIESDQYFIGWLKPKKIYK